MNTAGLILASVGLGYTLRVMRPIKSLVHWNWKRVAMGWGKHITEADAYLFVALHPVKAARAFPWSPWYQAPPEPINLDEIFFRPKEKASDRADS